MTKKESTKLNYWVCANKNCKKHIQATENAVLILHDEPFCNYTCFVEWRNEGATK